MRALLWLSLALPLAVFAADKADKETVELVELFLKADTGDLPPDHIPRFLAVEPASLPPKLRERAQAKQSELRALMRVSKSKKKGYLKRLGVEEPAQCRIEQGSPTYVQALLAFGFDEIYEDEEKFLMERTRCEECELQEESSLTFVLIPAKKKGERPTKRMFMSMNDPFHILIATYRKKTGGQTDFFGVGSQGACR